MVRKKSMWRRETVEGRTVGEGREARGSLIALSISSPRLPNLPNSPDSAPRPSPTPDITSYRPRDLRPSSSAGWVHEQFISMCIV